jgi:kumamolisin
MQASERVEVPGSERRLEPQHSRVGEIDMTEEVEVTVYLRPRASLGWVDDEAKRSPAERRRPTREEYAAAYGADPADVDAVRAFATHAGLTVTTVDLARRSVGLRGSVQAVADAFEAKLTGRFATSDRSSEYRARTGPLTVPASLGGIVTAVLGVDDRPQARVHFRAAAGGATSYTPVQVAEAYAFPAGSTGAGETVGIIELGGGFSTTDLATYFQGLGLSTPSVTAVSVDGGANSPSAF